MGAGMETAVDLLQLERMELGVALRCPYVFMAQEELDLVELGAVF
jgi:hypothetical protein